jgi:hypothetical protein
MTVNLPVAGKLRRDEWGIPLTQQCNDHDAFITSFRLVKRLSADTSPVNNSTALVTISGLTTALEINTAYLFDLYVVYSTNATADLKLAWSLPAGSVADFGIDYWDTATVKQFAQSSTPPTASAHGGFASDLYARFSGSLATSSTAGNFTVQFAQNVANLSNSLVRRGSYLRLEKVPV